VAKPKQTLYTDVEKVATVTQMHNIGLNPMAFMLVIESYIENVYPLPVKYEYEMRKKDERMDWKAPTTMVELYIGTAGYMGKFKGSPTKLDKIGCTLLCRSYYEQLRPAPVSFNVFNALEIHVRTPGISDFDPKNKNPFREIKI